MIIISGSLAYDRIMDFPGYFKDHVLPEKIHAINLSFAVPQINENFGGTAGNIAFNLALLGEKPLIWAAAGNDFTSYSIWLKKHSITEKGIKKIKNTQTASAYIVTDKADNQITGFVFGAINTVLPKPAIKDLKKCKLALIASENVKNMRMLASAYKKHNIPYIYDPSQQIPVLSAKDLRQGVKGAHILIGNDYEISLITKKTGWSKNELKKKVELLVETLGEKGSIIYKKNKKFTISPAKAKKVADPTGAGDAYRAGLIHGILKDWSLEQSGRFAGLIAVHAVEKYGTQNHTYNWNTLKKRYKQVFGEKLVD